jgi:hypothetical protein
MTRHGTGVAVTPGVDRPLTYGETVAAKIQYRTTTLESPLPVPRVDAWEAITARAERRREGVRLSDHLGPTAEIELSVEPPWRRVVRLDAGHESALVQTSFTIRDDGQTCLLAWSCLIDPTDLAEEDIEALVDAVRADGEAQIQAIERALV